MVVAAFFNTCRNDQLVMTPVWRVQNGYGPSWRFGQAQVTTDTSFQENDSLNGGKGLLIGSCR